MGLQPKNIYFLNIFKHQSEMHSSSRVRSIFQVEKEGHVSVWVKGL